MKKIGFVLSQPPVYSETFFINKIKGLQAAGHDVILYVQNTKEPFDLCKIVKSPKVHKHSIIQLFISIWTFVKLLLHLKQLLVFMKLERKAKRSNKQVFKNCYTNAHLLKAKVDWLHFGFGTIALQSENVASAIGAKMAVSFRGFDIDVYPLKFPNCYDLLWTKVDKVHVISNYILKKTYETGLPKHIPIQIITPAIDKALFKPTEIEFRKTNSPIKLLTVARLHWIKGLIDTLEALSLLKQKGVNFSYTIIGNGAEYEPIKFAIYQLQLEKDVHLVGQKTHKVIVDYMITTDIYLQYSISEGFCNAVLEAQAMGLLCVVSDAEGLQENVLHNQTGIVVPKQAPKLLANAIEAVIHMPLLQKQAMQREAQERVARHFNLNLQQAAFIEFYKMD